MYPTIVDFGPIGIHSYGLMLATAFITVAFVIQSELKRRGFVWEVASIIVMAAAIGGIIGAKLYAALLDGHVTFHELFSITGWSGMGVLSAAASRLLLWFSDPKTRFYRRSISSGPTVLLGLRHR